MRWRSSEIKSPIATTTGLFQRCRDITQLPVNAKHQRKIRTEDSIEVAGSALGSLALFALCNIVHFAILEDGLHFNFATTRAVEMLGAGGRAAIFRDLCHGFLLKKSNKDIQAQGEMSTF